MLVCVSEPWFKLMIAWLLATGMVGFFGMSMDKARGVNGGWRIPENVFFLLALLGGFWGVLAGEPVFHHKTRKVTFNLVILSATALWLFSLSRTGFFDCLLPLL